MSLVRGLVAGIAALLLVDGLPAAAPAANFEAVVTHVSDGDTVWLRLDRGPGAAKGRRLKVRLLGLDAPERCQAHGPEASAALAALVLGRRVQVRRDATDDYGRALGTLRIDDQDVGTRLVADGHAWSARYRGDPGPYAREEDAARRAGHGLFAQPAPEPPREFRHRHGPCP